MRLKILDQARGIAIILMILFHLNYYLENIFFIHLTSLPSIFWVLVGKIAVITFILVSGIAFYFAVNKYKQRIYKKYIIYSLVLWIIAGGISLITYIFIPTEFIIFGIIHFFALSFLLLLFFKKFGYFNLIIGIGILLFGYISSLEASHNYLSFLGLTTKGFISADFYPIIPYFGYTLIGFVFGKYIDNYKKNNILKQNKSNKIGLFLSFIGKRSLIIYLLHPPIIIVLIWFFLKF